MWRRGHIEKGRKGIDMVRAKWTQRTVLWLWEKGCHGHGKRTERDPPTHWATHKGKINVPNIWLQKKKNAEKPNFMGS